MSKTNIVIVGIDGKMGKALVSAKDKFPNIKIVGHLSRKSGSFPEENSQFVWVDFSTPENTKEEVMIEMANMNARGMVIGTTGLDEDTINNIHKLSLKVPIALSSNFSLGANFLFNNIMSISKKIDDYNIEIEETHSNTKKDSPSGTALTLKKLLKREDININSIRIEGDFFGEHIVKLIHKQTGEALSFSHKANGREDFAVGALMAAEFISNRRHGFYDMEDILRR